MKTVIIKDMDGNSSQAYIPESQEDIQNQMTKDRRANLKEHLYLAFLLLGVISFSVGIYISIKRLKTQP